MDRETLRAKYELPVFTVSSVDFQKVSGLRRGDGAPAVWREAAGTEIPALRRFVHERTLGWGESVRVDPLTPPTPHRLHISRLHSSEFFLKVSPRLSQHTMSLGRI